MSNFFKSKALQEMGDFWILCMFYNIVIYYKQLVNELNIIIVYNDKFIYLSPKLINVISNSKERIENHFFWITYDMEVWVTFKSTRIKENGEKSFIAQLLCNSYNFVHKHCIVGWIERCILVIFWNMMIFSFENEHLTIWHFWSSLIW